jgi:hypothetical protein
VGQVETGEDMIMKSFACHSEAEPKNLKGCSGQASPKNVAAKMLQFEILRCAEQDADTNGP